MHLVGILILITSVLMGVKYYNNHEEKEIQEKRQQQSQTNNNLRLSLSNTYHANTTWDSEISQIENPLAIHVQHILRNKKIVLSGAILDIYAIPAMSKIAIKIAPNTEYFEHDIEFLLTTQTGTTVQNIIQNSGGRWSEVVVVADIKETEFIDSETDRLLVNGEVLAIELLH